MPRIGATIGPSQVVSVQINYDPGWRASAGGQALRIRPDPLGMMIIDPGGSGPRAIGVELLAASNGP